MTRAHLDASTGRTADLARLLSVLSQRLEALAIVRLM
jgi:hypothetical protein